MFFNAFHISFCWCPVVIRSDPNTSPELGQLQTVVEQQDQTIAALKAKNQSLQSGLASDNALQMQKGVVSLNPKR